MNNPLNTFLSDLQLPQVKTDVEVKPSTSLIVVIFGSLILLWAMFWNKKK